MSIATPSAQMREMSAVLATLVADRKTEKNPSPASTEEKWPRLQKQDPPLRWKSEDTTQRSLPRLPRWTNQGRQKQNMDQRFSWESQIKDLPHALVFPDENQHGAIPQTIDLGTTPFPWSPGTMQSETFRSSQNNCPPKRLLLEEQLQNSNSDEKLDGSAFQPFYLTSCFQTPEDNQQNFSYLQQQQQPQQPFMSSSAIQQTPAAEQVLTTDTSKPKASEHFYDHPHHLPGPTVVTSRTVYPPPPQFGCYNAPEGVGFLEASFPPSAVPPECPSSSNAYDPNPYAAFGAPAGTPSRFMPPLNFFPQAELMAPTQQLSLDSHPAGLLQQHIIRTASQENQRATEESASVSSHDSTNGTTGISSSAYFWQYNAQCKGPKAVRLINEAGSPLSCATSPLSSCYDGGGIGHCSISANSLNQYPLVVFEDPVQKRNDLVHCSKLRRGDGNDVTPNIMRLRSMGDELDRLASQITRQGEIILAGVSAAGGTEALSHGAFSNPYEVDPMAPASWRVEEAKREKNKLASKICRLKKKAFHESNKIKYTGLGLEYKELATLITHMKEMISNQMSPSLAQILKNAKSSHKIEDERQGGGQIQPGGLFNQAKWLMSSKHVTRVASRMDAFVEEVLSLARSTQGKHPLIKRLSSNTNSSVTGTLSREMVTPLPKFNRPETSTSVPPNKTPLPQDTAFPYVPQAEYEYSQRPGFPSALDLTSVMRSCSNDFQSDYENRQPEWFEYGVPASYQIGDESLYDGTAYVEGGYHLQNGQTPQTYLSYSNDVVPPQFYDTFGAPGIVGYHQSPQAGTGKILGGDHGALPASTDVTTHETVISVNCPRLPLKT